MYKRQVQDWDRGIIVGRRSFGKGLVQRPIELPDGSMIRSTIARYYTCLLYTSNTLAQKIKEAINTSFLNTETGIYAGGTQTELAMPLYWGCLLYTSRCV